jgi:hypothetical protein
MLNNFLDTYLYQFYWKHHTPHYLTMAILTRVSVSVVLKLKLGSNLEMEYALSTATRLHSLQYS